MKNVTRLFAVVCFACILAAFTSAVFSQDTSQTPSQQTPSQQQSGQVQSATGKLKSVDADAKKIVITSDTGSDMEFTYNDKTEVVGYEGRVEGLAGNAGADVTISYKDDMGAKTATRIDVKAKAK